MLLVAVLLFPLMGREFLPPFNEGALNINASLPPGSSLQESNRIGSIIEGVLHEVPELFRQRVAPVELSWMNMLPASTQARLKW